MEKIEMLILLEENSPLINADVRQHLAQYRLNVTGGEFFLITDRLVSSENELLQLFADRFKGVLLSFSLKANMHIYHLSFSKKMDQKAMRVRIQEAINKCNFSSGCSIAF